MKVENEQAILDRTVLRLPMRLLLCIALFACQDEQSTDSRQSPAGPDTGHGEAADLGPEPVDPSVVTVVRIEPEGHLFTAAGQRVGLTVTAFNGLGDAVEREAAAISWLSSSPEVAAVSGTGEVVASDRVGSTLVTATIDGVRSAPVMVASARVAPDVVTFSADEFEGTLSAEGEQAIRALMVPEFAVEVGQILLPTDNAPFGGRVSTIDVSNAGVAVVLAPVAVSEVFTDYDFAASGPLDETWQDVAGTGVPKAGEVGFECEDEVSAGVSLTVKPKFEVESWPSLDFRLTPSAFTFRVTGELVGKVGLENLDLSVGSESELKCRLEMASVPVPIPPALQWLLALRVNAGLEAGLTLTLTAAELKSSYVRPLTVAMDLGLSCAVDDPETCNAYDTLGATVGEGEWTFGPDTLADSVELEGEVRYGLFTELRLYTFLEAMSLLADLVSAAEKPKAPSGTSLVSGFVGTRFVGSFATPAAQFDDPEDAAGLTLQLQYAKLEKPGFETDLLGVKVKIAASTFEAGEET